MNSPSVSSVYLVITTAASLAEAEKIAGTVVPERLAACANLLPQIDSRYWWEGRVRSGQEVMIFMKTTAERYPALESRIRGLHSYDTPEIVALPIVGGNPDYLRWIQGSVC